jgi:hypothetical protein
MRYEVPAYVVVEADNEDDAKSTAVHFADSINSSPEGMYVVIDGPARESDDQDRDD